MTQPRRVGTETPFSRWLREQPDLDSVTHGLYITDQDMICLKYKEAVDGIGKRALQLMQNIEAKTYGAAPTPNQLQALFYEHQLKCDKRQRLICAKSGKQRAVWHFGCSILCMDGEYPGHLTDTVRWSRFQGDGSLLTRTISVEELRRVVRFDLAPDSLEPFERRVRRHHKTVRLQRKVATPLGFECWETIVERS